MKSTLLTAAAITALAGPAFGQSTDGETIIVTATRSDTLLSDTPAPISVVGVADFEARQALDYKDVLERLPNVEFFGGPRPSGEMPTVRGATGRQLVIVVDGVRQSASPGLATPLYFEPAFLSQVEVLRGASSVLYGPGAIGGVLSFETLSPERLLGPDGTIGADARFDYHDVNEGVRGVARAYGAHGAFSVFGGVSYREWGEITQGGGNELRPSDGEATDVFVRGNWQIDERYTLGLSHQFYDTEDFRPNNPQADNTFPYPQNNWARQNQTVLSLDRRDRAGLRDLRARLYRTELQTGADRNENVVPVLTANHSTLETVGGSVVKDLLFETGGLAHRVTIGADAYRDEIVSRSNGAPDGVSPDGEQQATGVFVRDEIALTPWLTITPAFRWDRYETSVASGIAPDTSSEATSPQLTVSVRPVHRLLVYASYGEAFRAPSVSEMFQSLTGNTFFANFAPNPGLQAEDASDIGLGATWTSEELWTGARATLRADAFRQDVDNLIVSRVIGTYAHVNPVLGMRPIQQYQNVSRAEREGFELAASLDWSSASLDFGYGQVRATDRDTGENLFSPPDKWTLNLGYDISPEVNVRWQSVWVEEQDYDSTLVRRRPAYNAHDAFLTWSPEATPWRVDVGVTNLFDERYLVYKQSTAYPTTYEQGRGIRFGLGVEF